MSQLFDDADTTMKLRTVVSAIVDWRIITTQKNIFDVHLYAEYQIALCLLRLHLSRLPLTVRSLTCWLTELKKVSTSLHVYFSSAAILRVAWTTKSSGLNVELMDVLAVLV